MSVLIHAYNFGGKRARSPLPGPFDISSGMLLVPLAIRFWQKPNGIKMICETGFWKGLKRHKKNPIWTDRAEDINVWLRLPDSSL
jgi:hypothetical protein